MKLRSTFVLCAEGCNRQGDSAPCPMCGGRVCASPACATAHAGRHLKELGATPVETAAIVSDPDDDSVAKAVFDRIRRGDPPRQA